MTDEEKLKAGRGQFNYKGNDCRQIIGGWIIHNTICKSFEEVEDVLMNIGSIITESIPDRSSFTVKADNGGNVAINDFKAAIREEYSWDKENNGGNDENGVNSGDSALVGDNLSDGR